MIQTKATGDETAEKSGETRPLAIVTFDVIHTMGLFMAEVAIMLEELGVEPSPTCDALIDRLSKLADEYERAVDGSAEPERTAVSMNQTSKHEAKP